MTPEQYRDEALRTEYTPTFIEHTSEIADHKLSRIMHGMIGLATEAGEFQDALKKHLIYGKPIDLTNLVEEIGDLCWYANIILDAIGSSWGECFQRNIEKLRARYPDKFTQERALTRDLDAERAALAGDGFKREF